MAERNDWNKKIIEEFRANRGKVGGMFEATPLLLLHHSGARTGAVRVNPLAYATDGDDRLVVFASKGGSPTNPDWFHNLKANPRATVEVGTETFDVRARVAECDERERLWNRQTKVSPGFADYQRKTKREIPVIILERVP
jgi:deazaflavin-dependent oxidoreductase (nitroreductase family)